MQFTAVMVRGKMLLGRLNTKDRITRNIRFGVIPERKTIDS